ncbi:hypothetical protein [Kitasatospora sp. NBC_01539]|uniref:hypothetical protein n=1 Tax=Kitasatospora sp. NBC_01539 TaxID=2903577 RepID=UPI0038603055
MGAGTPLRSASVAGPVDEGPGADGTAPGAGRADGARGRGGEDGPAAGPDGPRRTARPPAPARRGPRTTGRTAPGPGRDGRDDLHHARPAGPFEGRGPAGEHDRAAARLARLGLTAPPGPDPVAGLPLDRWVRTRLGRHGDPGVPWAEARPLARALVDLLDRVHGAGLALRDLHPGRVVVRPDGRPLLLHPEPYPAPPAGTTTLRRTAYADDRHALGGLLFLLATGHRPHLAEEFPQARPEAPDPRPPAERLRRWLALAALDGRTARRLAPSVLGLRADAPADRWTLPRVRAALDGPDAASGG